MNIKNFLNNECHNKELSQIILRLCKSAIIISNSIRNNKELDENLTFNSDGDKQKPLDVYADNVLLDSINLNTVYGYCSEEQKGYKLISENGNYIIITDPLDGSSNIECNVSVGTIFSILPKNKLPLNKAILQSGNNQICAGYFIYGPKTELYLTLGKGSFQFFLDKEKTFKKIRKLRIDTATTEYSINSSYRRFWNKKILKYILNCEKGKDGVRKKDFKMRWVGSLVADTSRIFAKGGIFLYPEDKRKNNLSGRLRLTYEANPISFLVEQAGGKSINGIKNILNLEVLNIHQRTPLVFGSKEEVDTFLNTE